ncbi:mannose-1-phosphate guanylyltransferase [Qipengyuania atrilutea]|uniref:Mannose-1-phosphate guanylyltransferase n=1 Tax=Qipengyuania atrilutea TaxID=2744473 RepID=A0A850H5R0_9SPHN|nr:mannose-1-phosphate guanylyltransferase [Actirhodobacter atriluteus]NVD45502.1 mannose-1-phosphate guanylyltransferase [Actirhodobacter atriluteus]
MSRIYPIILCGGGGTRLWPRSRRVRPKPFLKLLGDRTLFQQTLDRTGSGAGDYAEPLIVAGAAHVDFIEEQASADAHIIVEPAARNTAPAIALAAHRLPADAVMLVCPSDHHIADTREFERGVARAAALAGDEWLVSFGIAPTRPETGYGYIRTGEPAGEGHRVAQFVEKPDAKRAAEFLADGGYVWNGGIFAFKAGRFLDELERHRPEMAHLVKDAAQLGKDDGRVFHPASEPFSRIEGESVDYAVMENTDRAAVVSADMGWSDIGNWDALFEARLNDDSAADENGNLSRGVVDLSGCRGVMVETDGPRVSVVGVSDLVIVVDGDDILVTTREGAQDVGTLPGAKQQ